MPVIEIPDQTRRQIVELCGCASLEITERVQSLWSGYGEILRVSLDGEPAIVKVVTPPTDAGHPRGWDTDRSRSRKLRSYDVERAWYRNWAHRCSADCRVASPRVATELSDGGWLFVLEDLDASGFPRRQRRLARTGVESCLRWLASFHIEFLGERPSGLWEVGTYWHLATRPDEWSAMQGGALKSAAQAIDRALTGCRFPTIVHGDAKVANFCFSPDGTHVAAVDFQYTGGGCGMKDVAYFLGSCLTEEDCEKLDRRYLDFYFDALRAAAKRQRPDVTGEQMEELEEEWRELFPIAWTDFYRFLAGWSPGHPKMNPYSEKLARDVTARFAGGL